MSHKTLAGMLLLPLLAAESLRVEKTDRVGRRVENEFYVADLSHRTIKNQEEDAGSIRGLTYKKFGVTLLRTSNRMHWAPNLQREGARGYKGVGTWHPVQVFREERKGDTYIHYREGYLADYPEVKIEAEYQFLEGVPYFLFRSRLTVEKPLTVILLRNNEMTMDSFFTHVAWPSTDGSRRLSTFDERKPLIEKNPIAVDAPWTAFLNLEKGYGYGFVNLDYSATRTRNPEIMISDGAENGKYWSRRIIAGEPTLITSGDKFDELTAFVLFQCSKGKPLDDFLGWEAKIRSRFGVRKTVR